MNPKRLRALVVDDSALVRRVLCDAWNQDPEIEVVGVASDPCEARDMILSLNPDVLILDIEMPRMDGLTFLLNRLPDALPGICIVQHIPPVFSRAFAARLNESCVMEVREAASGDKFRPGLALVAPGDFHMMIVWNNGRYRVVLNQRPPAPSPPAFSASAPMN